jgi:hypothetical protein
MYLSFFLFSLSISSIQLNPQLKEEMFAYFDEHATRSSYLNQRMEIGEE